MDWNDAEQKADALNVLLKQIESLTDWVTKKLGDAVIEEPLRARIEMLAQLQRQDLEAANGGGKQIRQGVAEDRRISIEDPEMRHGRKSKSKRFNGYKQHILSDLDTKLIYAGAVTAANVPEEEGAMPLKDDLDRQEVRIGELSIDRAYINSPLVSEVLKAGGDVLCKPWALRGRAGRYSKADFDINVRDRTITCPAGQVEAFEPGQVIEFDPEVCGACPLRGECTHAASGKGRTVQIAADEQLRQRLRKRLATPSGRAGLRRRTGVEHDLAHVAVRQGPRARYMGTRKNVFDLRRLGAIQNLETIQRQKETAAMAAG